METGEMLIAWYLDNKRDLPWRHTKDPYYIWLSEVILQQTRVQQGLSYYLDFVEHYPTVHHLAAADEDEVLKLWQGLGYYSRARNLLHTAREISATYGGNFPRSIEGLLKLKGVGTYTASAIGSFAFDLPYPVVDGNVMRVLARLYDVDLPVNSTAGKKAIETLAFHTMITGQPAIYNQAVMEFGALLCTPQNPACGQCTVRERCLAYAHNTTGIRPVKTSKKAATIRHIHYAVLESDDSFVFRKRNQKDIWQGLHDFPSLEHVAEPEPANLRDMVSADFPDAVILEAPQRPEATYRHILTHRRIEAAFWRFRVERISNIQTEYLQVPKEDVGLLAVPRLIHKYLEDTEIV